jgi:hypothetical protein
MSDKELRESGRPGSAPADIDCRPRRYSARRPRTQFPCRLQKCGGSPPRRILGCGLQLEILRDCLGTTVPLLCSPHTRRTHLGASRRRLPFKCRVSSRGPDSQASHRMENSFKPGVNEIRHGTKWREIVGAYAGVALGGACRRVPVVSRLRRRWPKSFPPNTAA